MLSTPLREPLRAPQRRSQRAVGSGPLELSLVEPCTPSLALHCVLERRSWLLVQRRRLLGWCSAGAWPLMLGLSALHPAPAQRFRRRPPRGTRWAFHQGVKVRGGWRHNAPSCPSKPVCSAPRSPMCMCGTAGGVGFKTLPSYLLAACWRHCTLTSREPARDSVTPDPQAGSAAASVVERAALRCDAQATTHFQQRLARPPRACLGALCNDRGRTLVTESPLGSKRQPYTRHGTTKTSTAPDFFSVRARIEALALPFGFRTAAHSPHHKHSRAARRVAAPVLVPQDSGRARRGSAALERAFRQRLSVASARSFLAATTEV